MFSQIHNYGERRWFVKIETPFQKSGVFYLYLYLLIMKYKITDSKLESVIFLYIDIQEFIQIERGDKIYFVNSEDDEDGEIRYDKSNGWVVINNKFITEIARYFPLEWSDCEEIVGRWVEKTLQVSVTRTIQAFRIDMREK